MNASEYGAERTVAPVVDTIELALATIGSPSALARALAVTPSHVSRLRKGIVGVGPECSIRLSLVISRPILRGLREDGHDDLADLLQSLLPFPDDKHTAEQRAFSEDLAQLASSDYRHIRGLIASLANAARRAVRE